MDIKVARAHAMKLIYEWEMGGDGGEDTRADLLELAEGYQDAELRKRMIRGREGGVYEMDEKI